MLVHQNNSMFLPFILIQRECERHQHAEPLRLASQLGKATGVGETVDTFFFVNGFGEC